MPPPEPKRRPVNVSLLEEHAARKKLRAGIVLPETKKKSVPLLQESFVPVIQAEVGSPLPLLVHRYRLLIPTGQIFRESAQAFRRVEVATTIDVDTVRDTLIRHFGGVTVVHQPPAPAFGLGARDRANVAGTLEQNEHVVPEFAAPFFQLFSRHPPGGPPTAGYTSDLRDRRPVLSPG